MVNEIEAMEIFLMNNTNTYKMFGIYLILIHNHYLKKDVLLLADVFEKFIFTCLKCYDLDSCHYFSASGLLWDVMLKMTVVTLEKINDRDKYMFFEQEIEVELVILIKNIVTHLKISIHFIRT